MIDVDNIIEVPGWVIENIVSKSKKIQITLSLDKDIIGERASNVVRGLTSLQGEDHPTFVGVFSPNESDESQSVLPRIDVDEEEESEDSDASVIDSENFIEVN